MGLAKSNKDGWLQEKSPKNVGRFASLQGEIHWNPVKSTISHWSWWTSQPFSSTFRGSKILGRTRKARYGSWQPRPSAAWVRMDWAPWMAWAQMSRCGRDTQKPKEGKVSPFFWVDFWEYTGNILRGFDVHSWIGQKNEGMKDQKVKCEQQRCWYGWNIIGIWRE